MVLWHGWSRKEVRWTIFYNISTPWMMTTTSKKKKWKSVEGLLQVCPPIVLKSKNLTRLGKTRLLMVTKISSHDPLQNGPKACDKTFESIDFVKLIIRVNTYNIVMWIILPNNSDKDCFKFLTSREILKIRNPFLEEHYVFLRSHTFVSHKLHVQKTNCRFAQFNRIWNHLFGHKDWDWMVCPFWKLWDLIVFVLGNVSRVSDGSGTTRQWCSQTS